MPARSCLRDLTRIVLEPKDSCACAVLPLLFSAGLPPGRGFLCLRGAAGIELKILQQT